MARRDTCWRTKVHESFGPRLEEWLRDASNGKQRRLAFLRSTLGIEEELPGSIRYQLLHRTASPLIEATRIGARYAAMIVHSFSDEDAWLEDYRAFHSSRTDQAARNPQMVHERL